jgi:hypothetical protein
MPQAGRLKQQMVIWRLGVQIQAADWYSCGFSSVLHTHVCDQISLSAPFG